MQIGHQIFLKLVPCIFGVLYTYLNYYNAPLGC